MALPKWLPFVRRPPPAPPAEARTVHIYWFTAACFLLLLLRLWLWHTAGQRAKRKALLEAERAISARRSAARHHDGDLPPRSSDIYERVQDCLRLWREVRSSAHARELKVATRCSHKLAELPLITWICACVLRPNILKVTRSSSGFANTFPSLTSLSVGPVASNWQHAD
eukprot:scaffold34470_cov40-Tisochrysis_lutea.AAC.1